MPVSGGGFRPVTMVFTVDLPNYPEWAIPFTKLIPKAYMDDGYDVLGLETAIVATCKHVWRQIDDKHWQIYVELFCDLNVGGRLPLYVDVDLVIMNERVWEEVNSNKT